MTLRDDLIAAKALIDTPEKWGKGQFSDATTGRKCIRGACAISGGRFLSPKAKILEQALAAAMGDGVKPHQLALFNDDPATTHADIMALFHRAIAAATENTGEAAK